MNAFIRSCAGIAIFVLTTGPAMAESDVIEGRRIMDANCASCHRVAETDLARHPEAPSFTEIAQRYPPSALDEALAEGIMVGHLDMPTFEFTPHEINMLIQFLESLQP